MQTIIKHIETTNNINAIVFTECVKGRGILMSKELYFDS